MSHTAFEYRRKYFRWKKMHDPDGRHDVSPSQKFQNLSILILGLPFNF